MDIGLGLQLSSRSTHKDQYLEVGNRLIDVMFRISSSDIHTSLSPLFRPISICECASLPPGWGPRTGAGRGTAMGAIECERAVLWE